MGLDKIRHGKKVEHLETLRQARDGRLIDVSLTASPIKDAAGRIIGVSKIARDITARKAQEREIGRLSRLYAALSQINAAIIRTPGRDELFEKICRVLVENCGFRMAWIGQPDAKTRRVIPVAQWGDKTNYLSQVAIYSDDRPEGRGPTGIAIREGRIYVCNEIARDPNTLRWREPMNRAGLQSMAAFPIRQGGMVYGALIIYSGEPGYFQDKETTLLQEAAADISFALDNLILEEARRQTVMALRDNETFLNTIIEKIPHMIFVKDAKELRFVKFNKAGQELLGYSLAELAGKNDHDLFPKELADSFTERDRKVLQGREVVDIPEESVKTRDKGERILHTKKIPVFDNAGQLVYLVGISEDITERKRLDEALRESQGIYHSLVEQLPAGVFRKDAEGRYVFVNPWFYRLKGAKAELFLGKTPQEVSKKEMAAGDKHPAQIKQLAAQGTDHHQQIMQTGRQIETDEHGVGPDGKEQHVHVVKTPIFDSGGKIVGTQGILFDVTAHVKAEEALKQEQTLLADLLNSVPDFIYFKDRQSRFVRINEALARRCKLRNADAAPGKTDFDLFSEEHARQAYNDEQRIMETGEPMIGYEEKETWPDGSATWVSTTKMPLRDREGRITGLVGISRSITANKALEEQFRQSQKMEAIGKLAGGVAHDFNNILAVIQMQAGLLKSSEDLTPKHKEFTGEIVVASQRAAALIRQLLLFSRRETMRQSDLDLNESIHSMTKMLRRTLGEDIELQFKFSMKSLFVHADASMMDQVLMNLAVNARDAMPKGGHLTIETSAVDFDDSVRAQSAQGRPGSFVCLSVSDTGCGIPPENLPKIFEPFFTTKEVGKGTGLGLATVHGIVQQHQGWINVYSEVGKGTVFRIYLPRLANQSPKKAEPLALAATPGRNETILLVEDDPSVRSTVHKALSRLGYRVLEAVNGAEALDLWKKNRDQIDLVLTDMVMPGGMTGKELGEQLQRENPAIKLIYASGYSADVVDKDFRLEEGVNFLSKPFEMHKLAQVVRNSLEKTPLNTTSSGSSARTRL